MINLKFGLGNYDALNTGNTPTGDYLTEEEADSKYATIASVEDKVTSAEVITIGDERYPTKEITGSNGTALLWNETTGGGSKFTHTDGTESYVGVSDGGKDGMVAQIYADINQDGNWVGSRLNVYQKGIFYHNAEDKADPSYQADDPAHEVAVKGDIPTDVVTGTQLTDSLAAEASARDKAIETATSGLATTESLANYATIESVESLEPFIINIPVRTLSDKVYEKSEILGWFGVEDEASLKNLISSKQGLLRYGITLSTNPHYYFMPVQYIAFESSTQVKLVFDGLNTRNDVFSRYTILINLDGTVISGNTNVECKVEDIYTTKTDLESKLTAQYTSISENTGNIGILKSLVDVLQEKVDAVSKTNVQEEAFSEDVPYTGLDDSTADYTITGSISTDAPSAINAKTVTMSNTTITNSKTDAASALSIKASDVSLNSTAVEGSYYTGAGEMVSVSNAAFITLKDITVDSTSGYNMFELGDSPASATTLPKVITIDNCKFNASVKNNAVLVFATQDNAVININNCYFKDCSNALRLSNYTNAKNVTVNITNCTVDKWDSNPSYSGLILLQDYNSTSTSNFEERNIFGPDKITINITNLTVNGQKWTETNPANFCGTADSNQLIYMYVDKGTPNLISYDASKYPTINIG